MIFTLPHLFLVFALLSLFSATAQDMNLYEKRMYNDETTGGLPYRILYPENYNRAKKYPLVLFLHGGGERGHDNEKQLTHGAALFLREENRKTFPCIVVIPQCPENQYWASADVDRSTTPFTIAFNYGSQATLPLKAALSLVQQLISDESVDRRKVYVMGLSMGGMGTFEAVYRSPGLFAAAIPICGGGDVQRYDNRVKKTSFRIFHGARDNVVDVKYSRNMVERLKQLKANVHYTEYPDAQHNSWDNAFAAPDLLRWLFSNRLKK